MIPASSGGLMEMPPPVQMACHKRVSTVLCSGAGLLHEVVLATSENDKTAKMRNGAVAAESTMRVVSLGRETLPKPTYMVHAYPTTP